jgi:carboxymethylenebutenolidase
MKRVGKREERLRHDLSRRGFVTLSLAAGVGAATPGVTGEQLNVIETEVEIRTADGTCDAVFIHPKTGSHPGVLIWHDSGGLRPSFRELGRRMAEEGYSVLVPNLFYRGAKAPPFPEKFDPPRNPADMEMYRRVVGSFFAAGAAERDAAAYVGFLDTQREVSKKKKIGTHGYCLGGPYVLKTAAAFPDRVGAGVSFHGGFLATDKPDSPHLLAPKIKARLYFAIASDDDKREPQVKDKLREAFDKAKVRAEIEVYPNALHGWCVPDSKANENKADAERAWAKLAALYKSAL